MEKDALARELRALNGKSGKPGGIVAAGLLRSRSTRLTHQWKTGVPERLHAA